MFKKKKPCFFFEKKWEHHNMFLGVYRTQIFVPWPLPSLAMRFSTWKTVPVSTKTKGENESETVDIPGTQKVTLVSGEGVTPSKIEVIGGNIYLDLPFVCKMCTFSPTKTYQKGRHFAEDPGIHWVWAPLPGCNRDHQDDYIFRFGDSITTVNLHLPLLLGRGQTQDIPRTPMTSIFEGRPLHIKGHVGSRYILEPPYRIKSHLNVGTRDEK